MADKTLITMSKEELKKYGVINRLINKEINGSEAAQQLHLCIRQIKYLKAGVIKYGTGAIIHKSRGLTGNRKLKAAFIEKVEKIVKRTYSDFGPTLAAEKLNEMHHLKIGKETLRQLMINWELWQVHPRKKNKQYRHWRPRKEHYGEMQQFDGCYHKWFEDKAPECCLLAAIDDATGAITKLWFDTNESVRAVFSFWKDYTREKGAPVAIYLDKYSTYKINHKSAVDNQDLLTQFQRAAQEVGIRLITAHSPEAKGRVERLFETLQDRLVKELRLKNISTREAANEYLEKEFVPWFNKKFSVVAQQTGNVHRQLTSDEKSELDAIFSVQTTRIVNNDFTIRFKNMWLQLEKDQPVLVRKKEAVLIEERLDESIWIRFRERYLDFKILPERPIKAYLEKLPALPARKKSDWKPAANHPWRKEFRGSKIEKQLLAI